MDDRPRKLKDNTSKRALFIEPRNRNNHSKKKPHTLDTFMRSLSPIRDLSRRIVL